MLRVATAALDDSGRIVGWSNETTRLLGWEPPEVLGLPATELLASDQDVSMLPARGRGDPAGTSAEVVELVLRVRHRDDGVRLLGVTATPLTHASGGAGWLLSAIDLARTSWWDNSRSVLERFLTHSPYGIAVLDTELRYVWINKTLERMAGVPLGERIGRRMHEVLPGLSPYAVEDQMRAVLTTGVPILDFEYQGHIPADPEHEHAFSTSFLRLDDEDGRIAGVCYMGVDITERRRTRQRLALLTESGARIGIALDFETTSCALASVAVPQLADFAAVDLFDGVLRGEEPAPPATAGSRLELRRMAHASARPGDPEVVAGVGAEPNYPPASPMIQCLLHGSGVLQTRLHANGLSWLADDPARRDVVDAWDFHSLIAVPLRARGIVLGQMVLLRAKRSQPFDPEDLALAEELASRAALGLDNTRMYTRERETALALQHDLLPQVLPAASSLEVAHRYIPANARGGVGGDWFDVIPLSGARVALVVGDVTGHGLTAAATMGRLRTAVHTLADIDLPPDELLAHLDDLVLRLVDEESALQQWHPAAFAALGTTCLYAVYDPATRQCTMARAGHLPPAIVTPDGEVTLPDLPAGPPLGIGALPFESATVHLPDGALLALFTDGLLLGHSADYDTAIERLRTALGSAAGSLEATCDAVAAAMLTGVQNDDVALLLARPHGLSADHIATWDLRSDPAIVSEARSLASDTLSAWGLDDLAFTTELVVSELVTNAIRYASEPVQLRLIRRENVALICEVSDGSSTSPRLRHARTTDEGGRGLFLIAQLTSRWGTRYTSGGKVIWAEQAIEPL
ncbi:SpoIIE family protein phosphatase [Yinghuangia seranimata]|uniref:SpoIIE family protein phosphatase n=1 Tax=Yinghuangia seranimata TaxID=408067 RepID=UPI00248C6F0F|nr:SpoIIE family protein phosphatase [Yinghuangia seranimata]MDI2129498.1 SpoIIE family protein phosphatase [Yinghuangia seranimata]